MLYVKTSSPSLESGTASARSMRARWLGTALALTGAFIAGCSGGSGADVEQNPGTGPTGPTSNYNGPAPSTPDVQQFKINLWDNVQANNRCGTCHSDTGGQAPMFARRDDINLAYAAANGVVTLSAPQDSTMVSKVGAGHNCWLSSGAACGSILTTWITNWAGSLASTAARKIELEPPVLRPPGQSKNFPADQGALFLTTVYPLLEQHCSDCHASDTALKQQPFFAEGPPSDLMAVASAYEAAKSKMDLDDPSLSRFVVRLRNEFHNCWTASCTSDADALQAAIQQFANGVTPTSVDPSLVTSMATTLYEGTIASGGNRHEANVIALYEFNTGQDCGTSITGACATAYDTSGVDPAMDLTLSGPVQWFGGWGLNFAGGKAQSSTASSSKLKNLIGSTGEYSIEAWITPGNVVQEDMRIVSYSAGLMNRNFNLGQTMYNYDFFNRTDLTNANGDPQLSTPDADEVLQASLQHVVATFDPATGRKIYVNGVLVASLDPAPGGTLTNWDNSYAFVLGNEVSSDRDWNGVLRLVAVHNRVLTQPQIVQNFEAGVGEKFFLMFSVEHLTNVNDSFVVVEGSQFDSYGYLFRNPFFISLDGTAQPAGIPVRGMRIGLNGAEAHVGQSFANLDTQIDGNVYSAATGQSLTALGAVVPLEKGPDEDEFFLTFDALGANTYVRPAPPIPSAPTPEDLDPASLIGVRTFDEISASMAAITGVSQNEPGVVAAYDEVRQSMPAIPSIEAFMSSQQAAIGQLAIEYCHALVENPTLRASTFPGFDFNAAPAAAFANENALFDPLLNRVLGLTQLAHQPDKTAARTELSQLVNGHPSDPARPGLRNALPTGEANDAARTRKIAKAACAAVVGSAAMLVQ
jgi:hypothetical protein